MPTESLGLDFSSLANTVQSLNPFAATSGVSASESTATRLLTSPVYTLAKGFLNSGTALWNQMYKDFYANPVTLEPIAGMTTAQITTLYTKANVVWNKWPDVVKKMGPYDSLSNANKTVFRNLLQARYGLDKGFVSLAVATMTKMRQAGSVPDSVWNPAKAASDEAAATALALQQGGVSGLVANVKQKAGIVAKDIENAASTGMSIGGFLFKWRKPLIVVGLGVAGYIYAKPLITSLKIGKRVSHVKNAMTTFKDAFQ